MTYFIGDVHGKFRQYRELIRDKKNTIQVGDMGVGFRWAHGPKEGEFTQNPPFDAMVEGNHRFIRGNHDNPSVCRGHKQWIADGRVENDTMFIGGAVSIDRAYRTEGYSWWPDEELSTKELNELVDKYDDNLPEIMVTHDCPESIAEIMVGLVPTISNGLAKLDPQHASRSRQAFQSMLDMHRPRLWVYGHWHTSFDRVIDGTRFVCLAELEGREIE